MKGLICFLTGAAVGAVGTFFYIQKYVIPQIKDDILKKEEERQQTIGQVVMDAFFPSNGSTEGKDDENLVVTDHAARVTQSNTKNTFTDYSRYSGTVAQPSEEQKDASRPPEEEKKENIGTPYLIDANSFDEFSSYNAHAFVLYSDGVVIDDDTEEILDEDPELVFGKTAMDVINSGKEDIIYIRNDEKKQDYSLERRDYPFDGPSDVYRVADPDDWRD